MPKAKTKRPRRRKKLPDLGVEHPRDVIIRRLDELGKTNCWVARNAGSSEAVVYRYLAGRAETSFENVQQMLRLVGYDLVLSAVPVDAAVMDG